jgi:hypothetical protein
MANQKQDGSNLINLEYCTGRCKTLCEQCFVNLGQQGMATCKSTVNPGHMKGLEFAKAGGPPKYAPQVQIDQGKAGYVAPPNVKRGFVLPPNHEQLLARITPSAKGFYNIPTQGSWEAESIKAYKASCKAFDEVEGAEQLGVLPFFLRVSSMSDSSWAPRSWLHMVKEAWGPLCFFNSSICSLDAVNGTPRDGLFDEYHSLVVTVNPGHQALPKFREASSRDVNKAVREAMREAWKRDHWELLSPKGTMGTAVPRPMDFLNPIGVGELGLGQLESVMKFYRLRALPTIRGRFETDLPVVITQMRFKGIEHIAEFARRYKLHMEIRLPSKHYRLDGDVRASALSTTMQEDFSRYYKTAEAPELGRKEVILWTDKDDDRNDSQFAGEASVFYWEDSFWRQANTDAYNDDDYVCDRIHGGCSHCGLCASLNGQGPTLLGVKFAQEENQTADDPPGYMLPYPKIEGAGYIGQLQPQRIEIKTRRRAGGTVKEEVVLPPGADFFAERMNALGVPTDVPLIAEALGWVQNPREPASPEECVELFRKVAQYVQKDGAFVESWNTHENAEATTAYAVWSLMVHAHENGLSDDEVFGYVMGIMEQASDSVDFTEGVDDLWSMWWGDSPWNDQFGPVREEE